MCVVRCIQVRGSFAGATGPLHLSYKHRRRRLGHTVSARCSVDSQTLSGPQARTPCTLHRLSAPTPLLRVPLSPVLLPPYLVLGSPSSVSHLLARLHLSTGLDPLVQTMGVYSVSPPAGVSTPYPLRAPRYWYRTVCKVEGPLNRPFPERLTTARQDGRGGRSSPAQPSPPPTLLPFAFAPSGAAGGPFTSMCIAPPLPPAPDTHQADRHPERPLLTPRRHHVEPSTDTPRGPRPRPPPTPPAQD